MNEDVESRPPEPTPHRPANTMRRVPLYAGLLLAVFLLGFVPMWLRARTADRSLVETKHRLTLATMRGSLASAAIDARRGDYEPARQSASQFFTALRAEIDKGATSDLTQPQRDAAQQLFAGRDEIITLLARSDPAAADRLSDLYAAYRNVMGADAS